MTLDSTKREKESPSSAGTVPFWFSIGSLLLICWAGITFFSHVAAFRSDVSDASIDTLPLTASDLNDPMRLGRRVFEANCAICHQTTGLGIPSQYPPLVNSEWVLGEKEQHTRTQLVAILLYGLQGPVTVRGLVYNGNMPAWNHLSDAEIAAVLSYIRSAWANRGSPVTAEEVSFLRKNISFRVEPWTWNELEKLPRSLQ
ncbi:MAG: cytochrome C oxidase Cbb3 [Verrucomicrobia bacterium]|nr:MAG: cytochrome C oxidase Cbb3 [Verrucomicrobiota bacterium]